MIAYKDPIVLDKELTPLDEFTQRFCSFLKGTSHVLVAGYVSILFGRSRQSEDVDLLISADKPSFTALWNVLVQHFDCLNAQTADQAFDEYLQNGSAVRFSDPGQAIPNMEVKLAKNSLEVWSLQNRKRVELNGKPLFIAPLEVQIPFKLWLGSEKDIEDARHLWNLFKEQLDRALLDDFGKKLKIEEALRRYCESP